MIVTIDTLLDVLYVVIGLIVLLIAYVVLHSGWHWLVDKLFKKKHEAKP